MYRLEPGEKRKFRIMKFEEVASVDGTGCMLSADDTWNSSPQMVGITDFPEKHGDPLYMALFCNEKDAQLVVDLLNKAEEIKAEIYSSDDEISGINIVNANF